MNAYALGAQQPSGPFAKIYPAWSKKSRRDVIVKVYHRSGITAAENLLREAMRQAREKPKESTSLIEILLDSADSSGKDSNFTVNFVLEKTVESEVLMRNDDRESGPPGLSAYQKQEKLFVPRSKAKIRKAYAPQLQKDVIIKSMPILHVKDVNQYIKEAFLQAYVEHDRNYKLIDFCITKKPDHPFFKIHLVMEQMICDMNADVEKRALNEQPYTEKELLHILEDVTAGLAHANTLHIAHRDIKPLNIFLGSDGRCKLGGFSCGWKKTWIETLGYVSNEIRKCMKDPESHQTDAFLSDIYSLGLTVMHFALLEYPIDIEERNAAALTECLTRRVREMHYSEEFKQLIAEMVEIDLKVRLRLNSVIAKVQMLQSEPTLVHVTDSSFRLFDFQLNSWKEAINFDKPIAYDYGSRYVFLDAARIVVCGNCFEKTGSGTEAYIVNLEGNRVQELPKMRKRRWGAGLIVENNELLAFGGSRYAWTHNDENRWNSQAYRHRDAHLRYDRNQDDFDYECYWRNSKKWTSLSLSNPQAWTKQEGRMSERKLGMTPCAFYRKVYLCGHEAIDVFNLNSRVFESKLPISVLSEDYYDRVSVIVQSDLVVISRERTVRINLTAATAPQVEKHDNSMIASNSSAVIVGEFVYWVRNDKCIRATLQQPTRFSEF